MEMVHKGLSGSSWGRRLPVLVALAAANEELVAGEIEVFDAQTAAFSTGDGLDLGYAPG